MVVIINVIVFSLVYDLLRIRCGLFFVVRLVDRLGNGQFGIWLIIRMIRLDSLICFIRIVTSVVQGCLGFAVQGCLGFLCCCLIVNINGMCCCSIINIIFVMPFFY